MKNFSSNASIYFPDSGCPLLEFMNRKIEVKNVSENKTCLVIEVPVGENGLDDSLSKKIIYEKF